MPRRLANLFLLCAVVVLVLTGFLPWLLADSEARPLYDVHRGAGIALLLSLAWKYAIVRASIPRRLARRDGSLLVATFGSGALLFALVTGITWSLGVLSFDRPFTYSALNFHVFTGALLIPLVALHALQRWERRPPAARLIGRRAVLRLLAVGAAAAVITAVIDRFALVRRLTGSRHAGSFSANAFPLTIWNFDSVPAIDVREWRVSVAGAVARPRDYTYDALGAIPASEIDALIDCTSGWWSEQRWRGVPLADLIAASSPDASASRVRVTSVTGHTWMFGIGDMADALLATHVGGEPLSPGHGYPLRLVAPGRRGFQWIKWVDRVEIS